MKNKSVKRRIFSRFLSIALVFAMSVCLLLPINVKAAKKITLAQNLFSTELEDIEPTVSTITKTGKYNIVTTKNEAGNFCGFLKFVAPKTKTYTITAGPVKGKKKDFIFGSVEFFVPGNATSLAGTTVKLKKSTKNHFMMIATKKYSNSEKKRVGTIKLRKGTQLYMYFQFHQGNKSSACTTTLKIK
ncbi:hypothetical protein [Butyrivibrio sp. INlla16]|uniref:hypothetical protein n=1 Tax=Butyrivibrio sp. INlla16 TaxID=1520807 RepID=UPI0008811C9F|nr:hypothetical protein [Butyrivibrio sp. INlla16]SDB58743.1 hypothetical protein SAMN02910263_03047 [Butyrivibrio sp. INlla16]